MIAIRIDKKGRLPQAIRALIAARLKQRPTHEFWSRFVEIIGNSSFLTGREQDADGELFQAIAPLGYDSPTLRRDSRRCIRSAPAAFLAT